MTTVAINTLSVSDANEGTRTMLGNLLPALQRVAPGLRQLLICSGSNRHLFTHDADFVEVGLTGRQVLKRIGFDQLVVPMLAKKRADVLVTPAGVGPLRTSMPHVMLVAAHLALPSCQRAAGDAGLGRWHRLYYGPPFVSALRKADAVLGISQFLVDGLVSELGAPSGRIGAMPLGVYPPQKAPVLDYRQPLVLFVGTLYGYKDAPTAVRAFARARPRLPAGARLVVVGRDPNGQTAELRGIASAAGLEGEVDLLGAVSDEALEDLYSRASLLVMPSRCEGFGLPIAEAMSRGIPVVVANATSLPEVAGGAGIVVELGEIDGFAQAMVDVLSDASHHRRLAERGLARARELTWEASAQRLSSAIEAIRPEPSVK